MTYDLVVIGGGVGGLTAAAYAAKRGLSVLVCEQNPLAGGMLAPYQQDGFRFDLRMPTLINMGVVLPILEELGVDAQTLRQPSNWQIILPRGTLSVSSLTSAMEQLTNFYPEQARSLQRLSGELDALACTLWRHFDPNPLLLRGACAWGTWLMDAARSITRLYHLWRAAKITVDQGLRRYPLSSELRSLMLQLGYQPMSYLLLAGLWQSFASDYFLPPQGISQLPILLEQRLRASGGEIMAEAKVAEILIKGGRAAGVRLADGRAITARSVIAACDLVGLYRMLAYHKPFARLHSRALATPVTQSYFSLFLGVQQSAHELAFTSTHTFWLPDITSGVDEQPDPAADRRRMVISLPSLQGSGFAPRGASALILSTPAPNVCLRGMGKEKVRHQVMHRLIGQVSQRWPQLRGQIVTRRLLTPLDYQLLTGNHLGASAGWSMDPHLVIPTSLIPWRTPLPSLYLAGQWVVRPGGVAMAMLTAKMAAMDIASLAIR